MLLFICLLEKSDCCGLPSYISKFTKLMQREVWTMKRSKCALYELVTSPLGERGGGKFWLICVKSPVYPR